MVKAVRAPAYLRILESGELACRVEEAYRALESCRLCPRECAVNRLAGQAGVCRSTRRAEVASAFAHFGEENCLRGSRGSGTIFFSWCNLRCVFCQNFDISWRGQGRPTSATALADLMLDLQSQGCHNINLVTPEHVVPQVIDAIYRAASRGLRLPVVYNTSAYDSLESLALLEGVVDIYMPDFKVWDPEVARRLLLAPDYPKVARAAIVEMHRQVGDLMIDASGVAQRGMLIRHLVMPGELAGTASVMRFLVDEVSPNTYVNLMGQYCPAGLVRSRPDRYGEMSRQVTSREYDRAVRQAREAGIHRFDDLRPSLP